MWVEAILGPQYAPRISGEGRNNRGIQLARETLSPSMETT